MKRKLDQNEEPSSVPETAAEKPSNPKQPKAKDPSFGELGLDPRLVQALAKQNFEKPTPVQHKVIPLALDGQDVAAKAPCGSGKTAAYVLPLLSAILKRKSTESTAAIAGLILVPTRELADQVFKVIEQFSAFCTREIRIAKLTGQVSDPLHRTFLSDSPDIVVCTPATAWHNINSSALPLDKVTHLIMDEADLLLSYGYDDDLKSIAGSLPKGVQILMMSATLTADMDVLQKIFGREQTLLDFEEPEREGEGITQYVVKCGEDEKFLMAYVIFKLKLITGKCIIFVNNIDRCYQLKLFLEQFGIKSCLLNSELPANSRIRCVEQFNRGLYDILIASDEAKEAFGGEEKTGEEAGEPQKASEETNLDAPQPKKKRRTAKSDKEYGMSRGIDFLNISTVINFDLPPSVSSYRHRIGRTARAGQTGMALSFYVPRELFRKHLPTAIDSAENDEKILAKIVKQQSKLGKEVKPYNFKKEHVDVFRYRMNDALRAVTKVAIRSARTRELRQELLNSEKLKRYFEENPAELAHLRHDGELRTARRQDHLRHVPDYLLPKEGKQSLTSSGGTGIVPFRKDSKLRGHKKGRVGKRGRKAEPLRTFKARRKP